MNLASTLHSIDLIFVNASLSNQAEYDIGDIVATQLIYNAAAGSKHKMDILRSPESTQVFQNSSALCVAKDLVVAGAG